MSTVTEAAAAALAPKVDPPVAATSAAARERFDRALANREREMTAVAGLIAPGAGLASTLDGHSSVAASASETSPGDVGEPSSDAAAATAAGQLPAAGAVTGADAGEVPAPAGSSSPAGIDATSSPVDESSIEDEAIVPDAALAAGSAALMPPLGAGIVLVAPMVPTSSEADGGAIDPGVAGIAAESGLGQGADAPAGPLEAAGDPARASGAADPLASAPDMPAFADLVARFRDAYADALGGDDGLAGGGWVAGSGQPMPGAPGQPVAGGSPAPAPAEAVRLAEFLIRQAPLSGSPGDPIQMIFPQGSGPIDQIVFMRDARGLFMVVSSQPGARDAVQRGLGELEKRLRERGIAVGAIRLADPVASVGDRGEVGSG